MVRYHLHDYFEKHDRRKKKKSKRRIWNMIIFRIKLIKSSEAHLMAEFIFLNRSTRGADNLFLCIYMHTFHLTIPIYS